MKNLNFGIALLAISLIVFVFSPFADTHWPKWFMWHMVGSVGISVFLWRSYHWSLGFAFLVAAVSGVMGSQYRLTYGNLNVVEIIDIWNVTSQALMSLFLAAFVFHIMSIENIWLGLKALVLLGLFHCIMVFGSALFMGKPYHDAIGILPNISIGPSMLVCLVPVAIRFMMHERNKTLSITYLVAAFSFVALAIFHRSSIAWAALIAMAVATIVVADIPRIRKTWIISCVIGVMGVLGCFVDGSWSRFWEIDRFVFWPRFLEWWWAESNPYLGAGLGAFRHFGPVVQKMHNLTPGSWWIWAHSDFVQIIVETGITGILSVLTLIFYALKKAYHLMSDYTLMISILMFCVVAMGNYPLRIAEGATIGLLLFGAAFKLDKRDDFSI